MKCPYCGCNEDRVLDTREQREGELVRRRRECVRCRARFSTVESISLSFPLVIKKDGRREPYNKEKILKGLQAAAQKRNVSSSQLEAVVEKVSRWALQKAEKEIPARLIGSKLMQELKVLDNVAYIRFASVYCSFKDVQEFVETFEEGEEAMDPIDGVESISSLESPENL